MTTTARDPPLLSPGARRRLRAGLALLAAFELVVAWVTFTSGATSIMLFSLAAGALLVLAAFAEGATARAVLLVGVAAATLARAIPQTSGPLDAGDVARYVVPVGFLAAAAPSRLTQGWGGLGGFVAIAAARAYFALFYLSVGATLLGMGNVLGAAGACLCASALLPARATRAPAP